VTLRGTRVLVTRAVEDAPEFEELLRARGAVPVRMPCIAFEDVPRERPAVEGFDLVVIASPHAARRFLDLIGRTSQIRFAAVGAATAAELPGPVLVPSAGAGAEALIAELADKVRGKRVLVPRAEDGNPALVEGLRSAGAQVETLTLYRTVTPRSANLDALRGIDAIAFASGSAVRGFVALAGAEAAAPAAVACMGRNCAEQARKSGIRVDAEAAGGLAELCDALALAVQARKH